MRITDESGASSVEYALLAAGIAAVIAITVYLLGASTNGLFGKACDAYNAGGVTSCVK